MQNLSLAQLFSRLGDLVEVSGTDAFPEKIKVFFESFGDISEFSILTFQKNAVPIPVFTTVSGADKNLEHYCNGLYLLDPFYDSYVKNNFASFAVWRDIAPNVFEESIQAYINYMSNWEELEEVGYVFPVSADTSLHFSFALPSCDKGGNNLFTTFLKDLYPFLRPLIAKHWQDIETSIKDKEPEMRRLHTQVHSILNNFGSSVLTGREQEIVRSMLHGHSAKSTAEVLGISAGTVNVHRSKIYEKLDISSNSELFSLFIDAMTSVEVSGSQDVLKNYLSH